MSSVLDNISSVNLLECLITNDTRWSWILDEWKASNDATQRDLAKRVDRFRESFMSETAGLIAGDLTVTYHTPSTVSQPPTKRLRVLCEKAALERYRRSKLAPWVLDAGAFTH